MMKRRSLVSNTNSSTVSSSDSASNDHKSLGDDYNQASNAHAPSLDVDLSSAMPPHREGVPCKHDLYI
jgi:hypothetical protein